MAFGGKQGGSETGSESSGATEPITLTDPDGAVTRVAPWSTWTREQVRAPGGEPALVTRLEAGQLWFAAGRRRSPWRHEVHVGPATVSTPKGRFHVTAEPDGGATIACLTGRTRVVAGLREPVVLGPDQTAAVASDGATVVVMDRSSGVSDEEPDWGDLSAPIPGAVASDEGEGDDETELQLEALGEPRGDGQVGAATPAAGAAPAALAAAGAEGGGGAGGAPVSPGPEPGEPRRWTWLPELVAVMAVIAVLVAAVMVFGHGSDADEATSNRPASTSTTTTSAPSTSTSTTPTPTTTTTPTTTPTTTTTPSTTPTVVAPGIATGTLSSCRRSPGGVTATVAVVHRSGGAGRFTVAVGLVDGGGAVFGQGQAQTGVVRPGATVNLDVPIKVAGAAGGSCELLEVVAA